jgi:hypothetical protein
MPSGVLQVLCDRENTKSVILLENNFDVLLYVHVGLHLFRLCSFKIRRRWKHQCESKVAGGLLAILILSAGSMPSTPLRTHSSSMQGLRVKGGCQMVMRKSARTCKLSVSTVRNVSRETVTNVRPNLGVPHASPSYSYPQLNIS